MFGVAPSCQITTYSVASGDVQTQFLGPLMPFLSRTHTTFNPLPNAFTFSPFCLNNSLIKVTTFSQASGSMKAIWCNSKAHGLLILNLKTTLLSFWKREMKKASKKEKRATPGIQKLIWHPQRNTAILLPDMNNSENTNLKQGYSEIMINETKQGHLINVSKQGQKQGHSCRTQQTSPSLGQNEWLLFLYQLQLYPLSSLSPLEIRFIEIHNYRLILLSGSIKPQLP